MQKRLQKEQEKWPKAKCKECGNEFKVSPFVGEYHWASNGFCSSVCQDTAKAKAEEKDRLEYCLNHATEILERRNFPKRFLAWDEKMIRPNLQKTLAGLNQKGFYLHGKTGSGKTCMAIVFAKNITQQGGRIYFANVPELLFEIKGTFDRETKVFNDYGLICRWAEKPMLILDDLGAEKVTEYVRQSLYTLINKRYLENLPTFFTSNLSLDEIAARLDDRISSRIFEMCGAPIDLGSEDLRLKRRAK